jgi:hypothetical protein
MMASRQDRCGDRRNGGCGCAAAVAVFLPPRSSDAERETARFAAALFQRASEITRLLRVAEDAMAHAAYVINPDPCGLYFDTFAWARSTSRSVARGLTMAPPASEAVASETVAAETLGAYDCLRRCVVSVLDQMAQVERAGNAERRRKILIKKRRREAIAAVTAAVVRQPPAALLWLRWALEKNSDNDEDG